MEKKEKEYIKLDSFLKMCDIVQTGGQAKQMIQNHELKITVNGESEDRRGRKLYPGDVVVVDGRKFVVR